MAERPGSLRIYLVEDSAILRNLLTELIPSVGATIVGHSDNAEGAIRDLASLEVDVVVVDINLREGDGFDVLRATHRAGLDKRLKRIVLSNFSLPSYRDAAAQLDVDGYFDKSTDITKMIEYLARL